MNCTRQVWLGLLASVAVVTMATAPAFAQKKANVVMLMTDDTGWTDFGATSVARPSGTRRRTSIASPRKERCSPIGMARPAAPPVVHHS